MSRKPDTIAFWRGRLPHWEVTDGRYFVTIHLAGAIPEEGEERIHRLAQEYDQLAANDAEGHRKLHRSIYAEMERWLDRAEVVAHLREPPVAEMLMEAIAFRQGRSWNVLEYVVMPNHLHLFFELLSAGLKDTLEQFKRWTGHRAKALLRMEETRFWQDEWFDHWSRSDEQDERISEYIRQNPVKAGLVRDHREWPFGSWSARK
jgi:type I restriction enzyme R subunit/putative DNA methylase